MFKSCHVCGMWIEICEVGTMSETFWRHATYVACGLKFRFRARNRSARPSCHVCGMWIEMKYTETAAETLESHATYVACGLKLRPAPVPAFPVRHATYVACGLKLSFGILKAITRQVMPRMWHVD